MILKNCTFFNEVFEKEIADIKIENEKIAEIGIFNEDGVDMGGKIIFPGFVDIHIHGGAGADFCDETVEAFDTISDYLAKRGVTSFCATTMTLPVEKIKNILSVSKNYESKSAKLVGVNLEGPYIAKSKKGAQNEEYVVAGSVEEFNELFEIDNKIKLITIAPEAFDSDEFIKEVSKKATVSIGHSAANESETKKAFDCGVRHATHLFNAMTPMTHREAGIVGAVLENESVMCELICDTEHICSTVLKNAFKILGENRACVISDSMRGAGLGVGEFELGGQMTYVKDGFKVAKLADGTIAASITNVFDEFKNLIKIGVDFKTALKSCTINPARAIKKDDEIGSIAVGKYADLVVVDENLEIQEVYINGALA